MMTGPLGHLERYPARQINLMGKSRSTWIVPIFVAIVAVLFYVSTFYKIDEAARRHSVAVVWDDTAIASVQCARFSNETDANLLASDNSTELRTEYDTMGNGDRITITELLSGFTSSRILHQFVVAEITLKDGMVIRRIVRMNPEILENGIIDLRSGLTETPDNNAMNRSGEARVFN